MSTTSPRAYYSEFNPYVAAWLKKLIFARRIPAGDVDTRDIRDVQPGDLDGYDQCHFFAGIAGWPLALALAGWPADRPVWTGSCPCQPLSAAGVGLGADDERHCWPDFHRLIAHRRPPIVFGEQVASALGRTWLAAVRADLEALDYAVGSADLCAAGIGAPHIRQRLFIVADAAGEDERGQRDARSGEGAGEGNVGAPQQGPSGLRTAGLLADAEGGRGGAGLRDQRSPGERRALAANGGGAGGLAHPERAGSQGLARPSDEPGQSGRLDQLAPRPAPTPSDARSLADAHGARPTAKRGDLREGLGDQEARAPEHAAALSGRDGGPRGLADADGRDASAARLQRGGQLGQRAEDGRAGGGRPGQTDRPWAAADWLLCRDGKWRPVEPRSFPLAHGLPHRLGALRAYGNAIVPPLAAEFVRAYMDLNR